MEYLQLTTSAEEVLDQYTLPIAHDVYAAILEDRHTDPSEDRWREYEGKILPIIKLPFGATALDVAARIYRPKAD